MMAGDSVAAGQDTMKTWRRGLAVGALAVGALAWAGFGAGASAQEPPGWSLYDQYTTSYTINYTDDSSTDSGLYVKAQINGGTEATFQIDTGSQGMVVPAYMVPGYVASANPETFGYSSSGNSGTGSWQTVTVTFPDSSASDGSGVATAEVQVFVMETYNGNECTSASSGCAYMIGVGFGRTGANSGATLSNNPLLNMPGMDDGTVRAGYVITPDGIQAGLTTANAGSGYAYVQLVPEAGVGEWTTPAGTVYANGNATEASAILLDTGINYMWTGFGEDIYDNGVACGSDDQFTCAPPGTVVEVYFGGTQQVGYTFTVGGTGNPDATPEFVRLGAEGMNTGLHPVGSFNYMFDSVGGFVGYQATQTDNPNVFFTPYLTTSGDLDLPSDFTTALPVYLLQDTTLSAATTALFSGDFTGASGSTLTFDGGTFTIAGDVTLPAGVTVAAGSVTFQGVVTAPLGISAGATAENEDSIIGNVTNAGAFINNGSVTGSVSNSGTMSGNGTVSGSISGTGTIAPGNSIGTIFAGDDVVFQSGSSYIAEIGPIGDGDEEGVSDKIITQGGVSIDDATLYVIPAASWRPAFASYRVIETDEGVSGAFEVVAPAFGSATSLFPFLDAVTRIGNEGKDLFIDVVRSDVAFEDVTATRNQAAVARALDHAKKLSFVEDIELLTGGQARSAFDLLSGQINASAKGVLLTDSALVRAAVLDRLRGAMTPEFGSGGVSVAPLAYAEPAKAASVTSPAPFPVKAGEAAPAPVPASAVWTQAFGSWGSTSGTGYAAALDRSSGGFFTGADTRVGTDWRLGAFGGYSRTSFDVDSLASSGESDNYHAGLYAGGQWGALGLRLGASYSWHDVETDRSVLFQGFADTLSASYDAATAQAFGEVGYAMSAGGIAFEPFAGLAYVSLHTDGFTEEGGPAALASQGDTDGVTYSTLGLRAAVSFEAGAARTTLRGLIGWRHAFGDVDPVSIFAFSGGEAFAIAGLPIAQDAAVVEAGLDVAVTSALTLGIAYSGQFGDGAQDQGVQGSLSWKF